MITVYGPTVDQETRCVHYHSEKDIIAIRFKCCDKYYPCYECHDACEDHQRAVWPKAEWNEKAILCGVCQTELTINEYQSVTHCPTCKSAFNEGCKTHYHLYFATR
ncbi:CHY zinc finger protein [Ectobacillus antri]|uniref:CHY zinc finger protein n=1 Tax=Ectobacillus antri TaxID=2486280 RepID=A0ABT6H5Z8_9BACI|nr:CHY zinc finger protein [Ectobacillus antri]MDG4657764.1 CHY zinc finger protein [Ectobacillus antri]MDG5754771.1 CHY zinc finger protein [Ectobacillus antri]